MRIGFEMGLDSYFGDIRKPAQLREFSPEMEENCGILFNSTSGGAELTLVGAGFGVKPEIFLGRNRWGISSGLRFSRYTTALEPRNGAFYWMFRQEGLQTDYLMINKFTQRSYYLGVPLEVRFFPNRRELPVQIYFKAGAAVNYRLHTDNGVTFRDPSMNMPERSAPG